MANKERPLYMIGVVAEMLGIHPQTLRLYEREGLIKPSRTQGNTRLYSERDVEDIKMILLLTRELGVNIAGVEVILEMRRKMERMNEEMEEIAKKMREEMIREMERMRMFSKNPIVKATPGKVIKVKIEEEEGI